MGADWKPRAKFVDPTKLSRKVFDKHVDRIERKRQQDKEEHRADLATLIRRIRILENELTELQDHIDHHCVEINTARVSPRDTEGL